MYVCFTKFEKASLELFATRHFITTLVQDGWCNGVIIRHLGAVYKPRGQMRERGLLFSKSVCIGGGGSKLPKILSTWFVHAP